MLPRRTHRPRLESGIELREPEADPRVEIDEPLSPEEDERRRAYAEWLARFERGHAAA